MRRWGSIIGLPALCLIYLWIHAAPYDAMPTVKTFRDRHGAVIGSLHTRDGGWQLWTPLSEIPSPIIKATLAREDRYFYWHWGVNPLSLVKATVENLRAGHVVRGGSTISQQLAKHLLQDRAREPLARTLRHKGEETLLALGLELRHSKDEMLAYYLNTIYYGQRAYGVAAAADVYFGKTLEALTPDEIDFLASVPRRPAQFGDSRRRLPSRAVVGGGNDRPSQEIVGRHVLEYLDQLPMDGRRNQTSASTASVRGAQAGKLADEARQTAREFDSARSASELVPSGFAGGGGRREPPIMNTTIDLPLQRQLESLTTRLLEERVRRDPELSAAIVVIDVATGDLLAMVGSRDYFDTVSQGQVNLAVALRQPGSTLKPFTYFAAFTRGYTPDTAVADLPVSFVTPGDPEAEAYVPQNFDRRYHGELTVRSALANSYNVPVVVTLNDIGLSYYHELLRRFGITTLEKPVPHYGLAVTLGAGEVTLLELTNAYATLARGGNFLPYRLTADDARTEPTPVVTDATRYAAQITDILADAGARRKSFGFNEDLQVEGHRVAVKTGTSFQNRDNWTVGYQEDYAVGVWVGHADATPIPYTRGGASGAGPLWHAVMEVLLRGQAPRVGTSNNRPSAALGRKSPHCGVRQVRLIRGFPARLASGRFLEVPSNGVFRCASMYASVIAGPDTRTRGQAAAGISRRHAGDARRWRVTTPLPNTKFRIHRYLPIEHQKIAVAVHVDDPSLLPLEWWLDGAQVAPEAESTLPNARAWITPREGRHRLRVRAADGTEAVIPFNILKGTL